MERLQIPQSLGGDWPSELRRCGTGRLTAQTLLGAWSVLGMQPCYEAPGHPRAEYAKH